MFDSVLLAKPSRSRSPSEYETLVGHTSSVMRAAKQLTECIGDHVEASFGLTFKEASTWKRTVLISAWLHDLGKANDHFQEMVLGQRTKQGIRHEAVSLFFIHNQLGSYFSNILPEWAYWGMLFSVAGHHLKFPDESDRSGTGISLHVYCGKKSFKDLIKLGVEFLDNLPPISSEDFQISLLPHGDLHRFLKQFPRISDLNFSAKDQLLISCIKSGLLAADLAGSALPRGNLDVAKWISDRLSNVLKSEQITNLIKSKLKGNKPRKFQLEVGYSEARTTILEAGCGSGKSIGAYHWARERAHGKRLFFCYPTTGTSSEGFSGYFSNQDFDALLIHSRAEVDYQILNNMKLESREIQFLRAVKMEALETWPIPAVVCTAHTVLGIMENYRRGLYAWPSLIQSVFIFDEVHSYSDKLFSYLLRFLLTFTGTQVLIMTATLPDSRREALLEVCKRRGGGQLIVNGPAQRENAPRYILNKLNTPDDGLDIASNAVAENGHVLWICNTVKRAQNLFDLASDKGFPAHLFHSRFKYRDRIKIQRKIIDHFNNNQEPILAIATQVAEMSLDLSADVLLSEYAPIPSMIQRLGRLNRFEDVPESCSPGYFLEPDNGFPYEEEDWRGTNEWIANMTDGSPKSQTDLTECFKQLEEKHSSSMLLATEYCDWIDGLWQSRSSRRSIEEAGYTVEVIAEEDEGSTLLAEVAIPMPFPNDDILDNSSWKGRYLFVPTESLIYDPERGGRWRKD